MPRARPPVRFTLAARICDQLAAGASLRSICAAPGMPRRETVARWAIDDPEFRERYEEAIRLKIDGWVDDMADLADSSIGLDAAGVNGVRLAIETRKWIASKMLPQRFGDRAAVELTGAGGAPLLQQPDPDPAKVALSIMALLEAARPRRTIDAIAPQPASLPPPDDVDRRRRAAQMDGTLPRPSEDELIEPRREAAEREHRRLRLVQFGDGYRGLP